MYFHTSFQCTWLKLLYKDRKPSVSQVNLVNPDRRGWWDQQIGRDNTALGPYVGRNITMAVAGCQLCKRVSRTDIAVGSFMANVYIMRTNCMEWSCLLLFGIRKSLGCVYRKWKFITQLKDYLRYDDNGINENICLYIYLRYMITQME